jgi:hypothetical protein
MDIKKCIKCEIEYNISFYEKGRNVCKSCRRIQYKNKRKEHFKNVDYTDSNKLKTCITCKLQLNITNFNKDKTWIDGYNSKCHKCYAETRWKKKDKKEVIVSDIKNKICVECKQNKDINMFKISSISTDGYYGLCNDCIPEKTWTDEKQKASYKKYVENNKDKLREKWKRDGQKINRRIRDSLNHRISETLKASKTYKNNTTFTYIECDREYFTKWFEFIFEEKMSWNNYGEWHIDHVIPCSTFDLTKEDDKKKCFSWKNLRPCWSKENISKGNKILNDVIKEHNIKVNNFINSTTKL